MRFVLLNFLVISLTNRVQLLDQQLSTEQEARAGSDERASGATRDLEHANAHVTALEAQCAELEAVGGDAENHARQLEQQLKQTQKEVGAVPCCVC